MKVRRFGGVLLCHGRATDSSIAPGLSMSVLRYSSHEFPVHYLRVDDVVIGYALIRKALSGG